MKLNFLFFNLMLMNFFVISAANAAGNNKSNSHSSTIRVGAGMPYPTPSAAAKIAKDGDTVEILAGTYPGDVAVWTQDNLTIRGVHGRPHLKADGNVAEGKAIWVIKGNNTTVENIEFSGAQANDLNGAGIRLEGRGLILRQCYFHDNEMGILCGINDNANDIVIEYSEFANNYIASNRSRRNNQGHNIYIAGSIRSFTLRSSYIHHAKKGHNVKSRAINNHILYSRIMDEQTGASSYIVDIPNGGVAYLIGNLLQQGPENDNYHIVSYGEEGLKYPENELYIINNTFVNEHRNCVFVRVQGDGVSANLINNIFAGPGTVLLGPGVQKSNFISSDGFFGFFAKSPEFIDAEKFDYRLKASSPVIDKGSDPGSVNGFSLCPTLQYVHPAKAAKRPIDGQLDIGAYEYTEKPTGN